MMHLSKHILLGCFLVFASLLATQAFATEKRDPYKPTKEQPFAPSYITTTGDHTKLTEDQWTDPKICGQCHVEQYRGWNGSMHSNSFKDPVFQAEWALAVKATDGKIENHCAGCHSPIGTVMQSIKFDPSLGKHGGFTAPPKASQGVTCDVCHTISGTNITNTAVLEHGNASFIMDPSNVKRGPLADAQSPYHETEESDHHKKSAFCGNCHNIFHPVNNFPIERTYDEWKYSIYAQNDIQCQDCHMVAPEIAAKVADTLTRPQDMDETALHGFAGLGGKFRKLVHRHGFTGGNAVVTAALGKKDEEKYEDLGRDENVAEAKVRLRMVAEVEAELVQLNGPLHEVRVKVTNKRAGHNLPTSLTEVRQVWLEVVIADNNGNELLRSGTLDENNELPEGTMIFNAKAVDKDGKITVNPWEIVRFIDNSTIPPRGHKITGYAFNLPENANGVKVTAKLHYRSFSQYLADKLLGKGAVTVPHIEMVSLERAFETNVTAQVKPLQADIKQQAAVTATAEPEAATANN